MSVNEFLEEIKKMQTNLLEFLDHGDNIEEKFQNLINIFDDSILTFKSNICHKKLFSFKSNILLIT